MGLNWFHLVLVYIVTNAVSKIMQKVALKDDEVQPTAFSAFFLFMVGILSIPFLFIEKPVISHDPIAWLAFFLSAVCAAVCLVLFYYAMKHTEVSQVETIATTRAVWVMILGVIFFQETLSLSKVIGVFFIFAGLIAIYWEKRMLTGFQKPQLFTLLYALLVSASYAFDKFALSYFSVCFYQVLIYIMPAVLTVLFFPGTLKNMKPLLRLRKETFFICICCLFQMISTLALYRAYQVGGELSVVGPLTQTSTVLTIFLGILFLKERWNLKRKLFGVALAILGIVFIKVLNF